jgi:hypothetical protein
MHGQVQKKWSLLFLPVGKQYWLLAVIKAQSNGGLFSNML